ncbi:FAD-dependent oxidoreductase [Alicyclobacillus fastidiosus]|uniref:FAD-dependent monooxygenase n=1 Tax=Alicyclobacillus fastidiosus TaxID=392011 RepID=A0ABV5AGJ1_9BACL|nr:FAD-dependent monooxygenase [Alicyclobacillus fastidiosus]WEH07961.1 FAD-dependent monooxygenase [Alicyclobacillus fastidiosus]
MTLPVIVVGAGPVGLTVADILSMQGTPVIVLEKSASLSKEWRASTFHSATMELLEPSGIADELMKLGLVADKVQYRDRTTGLFAEFDCNVIADETKYPFRLQCPQSTYVRLVNDRLQTREGVEIRYRCEVVRLEQDQHGVTVTLKTPDGQEQIRAELVLGADGARSTVRKELGFKFEGYTLEQRFLLVGTPVDFRKYIPDLSYVNYIADPEEFLFILRVPEAWRFLYPVPADLSEEVALDPDRIQRQLQKALHTTDHFPIIERMIYRVHQRVSEKFYDDRVILLGDAAHVNSPMGGLGLNSGIHDAVDLSRRLIRVFAGDGDLHDELETYSKVRREVALAYVRQITERNTSVLTEQDAQKRLQLQAELAAEANDPVRAKQWLLRATLISSVREQGIGERPPAVRS